MNEPEERAPGLLRGALAPALLLAFLGALLYFPNFALDELDDEEGRRALPAREMLESGDFLLPTLWGEPYLNKPPLYFWLVAGASRLTGAVDEAATRLPSVLATIGAAILLATWSRRRFRASTALAAGALFLVTFAVIEKGAFGELEAAFTFFVLVALIGLREALAGSNAGALVAGLGLTASLLVKGPPALVFYGALWLALARVERRPRLLLAARAWIPTLVAGGVAALWAATVLARPEVEDAVRTWGGQLARGGGDDLSVYLKDRRRFVLAVLAGFFPGSLVLVLGPRTAAWRRAFASAELRVWGLALALALAVFLFFPGVRGRYVHPLTPAVALLAAGVLAAAVETGAETGGRLLAVGKLVALLGLALPAAAAWLFVGDLAGIERLGPIGIALALALVPLALATWRSWRAPLSWRAVALLVAVLAGLRLVQVTEVVPHGAGRQGRKARAAEIERRVPEGRPLFVTFRGHYNLLFYVDREVRVLDEPERASAGEFVLVPRTDLPRLGPEDAVERLWETVTHDGLAVVLVRVSR